MCRADDFPPYLSPRDPGDAYRRSRTAAAVRDASPEVLGDGSLADTLDASRLEHRRRTAGRPRRVVYLEDPDELPPADPYDSWELWVDPEPEP